MPPLCAAKVVTPRPPVQTAPKPFGHKATCCHEFGFAVLICFSTPTISEKRPKAGTPQLDHFGG